MVILRKNVWLFIVSNPTVTRIFTNRFFARILFHHFLYHCIIFLAILSVHLTVKTIRTLLIMSGASRFSPEEKAFLDRLEDFGKQFNRKTIRAIKRKVGFNTFFVRANIMQFFSRMPEVRI